MNMLYLLMLVTCFIASSSSEEVGDASKILQELNETEKLLSDFGYGYNIKRQIQPAQCDAKDGKSSPGVDKPGEEPSFLKSASTLPTHLNWVEKGYLHEARDQYSCGACWAFPFVAVIQATYKMYTGEMPLMSVQHLVDCTFGYDGCAGGIPNDGFQHVEKTQFMPYETYQPWKGWYDKDDLECNATRARNAMSKMWLTNSFLVGRGSQQQMKEALQRGPVAAGLYISNSFGSAGNTESLYTDSNCVSDHKGGHAVAIVGYTPEYWLLQNSYGKDYGAKVTNCYDVKEQRGFNKYNRGAGAVDVLCGLLDVENRQFEMTFRRELEYALVTKKRLNFKKANRYCKTMDRQGKTGWKLATIPTRMHQQQVLDMMDESDAAVDNTVWIGLTRKSADDFVMSWADKFTPYQFSVMKKYSETNPTGRYVYMKRDARHFSGTYGTWEITSWIQKRHFVCSRAATCWNFDTAIRHATVTFSGDRTEGTTASITCADGFELIGEATLTCVAGEWGVYPSCVSV